MIIPGWTTLLSSHIISCPTHFLTPSTEKLDGSIIFVYSNEIPGKKHWHDITFKMLKPAGPLHFFQTLYRLAQSLKGRKSDVWQHKSGPLGNHHHINIEISIQDCCNVFSIKFLIVHCCSSQGKVWTWWRWWSTKSMSCHLIINYFFKEILENCTEYQGPWPGRTWSLYSYYSNMFFPKLQ